MSDSRWATRRLRGGLVGYGFIGSRGHVPAYLARDDTDIVAVADVCPARRALVAEALPRARVYDSAEAMLSSEQGRLDFVDIATPPCDHAALAHLALDAGLHVLCEKPLATTVEQAGSMLEHAMRARRVLFPCHNYKHAPVVSAIGDVLRSGQIGRVRSVTLQTFRHGHARGVREWNADWRRQVRYSGGGIAMDHGSHSLYLTFEWMRGWPVAVSAKALNQEPARWDTEDNFSAVLTFPGGNVASAWLTWTAGTRKVIYTLQGVEGAITVDEDSLELARLRPPREPDGPVRWERERRTIGSDWMDASHTRWFNAMFDRFVAALDSGDWVGADAQDAFRCIEVISAAYRSASQGCREIELGAPLPPGVEPAR